MTKRILLFAIVISIFACEKSDNIPKNDPEQDDIENSTSPNILLIIADDMGLDACSNYSEGVIKPSMPNLDKLAQSGITFENAWAYTICSPTRASILTGKYGFRTGVLSVENVNLSKGETSLQQYIKANSKNEYNFGLFGKWHLSNNSDISAPNDFGIDLFAGTMKGIVDDYYNYTLITNSTTSEVEEYNTDKLTDLSIDWIKKQDNPWFCWLAYSTPHSPYHFPPESTHNQDINNSDNLTKYLAMIENMDYNIGKLLSSLDEETLSNTLIIFIGDNGTDKEVLQLPYRGRRSKGSLYQGGINVPLIVSGKGVSRKNERDKSLVCAVDLFATIAETCGVNNSTYHDSYSFKTLFEKENEGSRKFSYSEIDMGNNYKYAISNGAYKLISNNDKENELYNLVDDPYEKNDLYQSSDEVHMEAKDLLIQEAKNINPNN